MVHRFNIYSSGHQHSQVVCDALAKGTGFPVVPAQARLEGGVATYGFLRGLLAPLRAAQTGGRSWVYVDRGYFRATTGDDYTGYFRVSRNAYQSDGLSLLRDPTRFRKLLLRIDPWRRGRHVLVCPPGDVFASAIGGFTAEEWLSGVLQTLKDHTDRPIKVRPKPSKAHPVVPTLAQDLQDCHALVTYMSNTAVEAVMAGVPVFTTGKCAASAMGKRDLTQIETPAYSDGREQWAAVLANNQWTLEEIRAGQANGVFA